MQNRVGNLFIKRLINYSLQAFERYEVDPTVLVICTNAVSDRVAGVVETSDVSACDTFPSTGWASRCLIAFRRRVQEHVDNTPLEPFVALCLFLTTQAITINNPLCPAYTTDLRVYLIQRMGISKRCLSYPSKKRCLLLDIAYNPLSILVEVYRAIELVHGRSKRYLERG